MMDHVNQKIAHHRVFHTGGIEGGGSPGPPLTQKFAHSTPPGKIPHHQIIIPSAVPHTALPPTKSQSPSPTHTLNNNFQVITH